MFEEEQQREEPPGESGMLLGRCGSTAAISSSDSRMCA